MIKTNQVHLYDASYGIYLLYDMDFNIYISPPTPQKSYPNFRNHRTNFDIFKKKTFLKT